MVLDKVNFPEDIRKLSLKELNSLAGELRKFIIESVSKTGGHLAPSLGVVELTIALHYVFNTPTDKLVWDVGHQAYPHKILTGRKDRFHTLRQYQGISGFPKTHESDYDTFDVGHSSTSISAALGMAAARDLQGKNHKIIAVIGDGAMSSGLAYEGINNAGHLKKDMIVILNDNDMSIHKNVGGMSNYLNKLMAHPFYTRLKGNIWEMFEKLPEDVSSKFKKYSKKIEESAKNLIVPKILFEDLGFKYFGPFDGHNIEEMIRILQDIKDIPEPLMLHVATQKGKGYIPARENLVKFHGTGAFNKDTGESVSKSTKKNYSKVFGDKLVELAKTDQNIVAITAAMASGTGLVDFCSTYPKRFFDVGIAESHAVTFAAALAIQGLKPFVAIYSSFLQRGFDQVIHDVALQNLPVVFILDRAGLVGEDGPTHHGTFDLSYLRLVPNLTICAPKNFVEFESMLEFAAKYNDGPIAIRIPRGGEGEGSDIEQNDDINLGKPEILLEGKKCLFLAIGSMVQHALSVADLLKKEKKIEATVVNCRFLKPMDREFYASLLKSNKHIYTFEENSSIGGLGDAIREICSDYSMQKDVHSFAIPDRFITQGTKKELFQEIHLDNSSLLKSIIEKI